MAASGELVVGRTWERRPEGLQRSVAGAARGSARRWGADRVRGCPIVMGKKSAWRC